MATIEVINQKQGTSSEFSNRTCFFDQQRAGGLIDGDVALGVVREEVEAAKRDPSGATWFIVAKAIRANYDLEQLKELHALLLQGAENAANAPLPSRDYRQKSLADLTIGKDFCGDNVETGARSVIDWLKQARQVSDMINARGGTLLDTALPKNDDNEVRHGVSPEFLNRSSFLEQKRAGGLIDRNVALGVVREEVKEARRNASGGIWFIVAQAIRADYDLEQLKELHALLLQGAENAANAPLSSRNYRQKSLADLTASDDFSDSDIEAGARSVVDWLKQARQVSGMISAKG